MAAGAIVEDGTWLGRLQGELRGLLAPVFAQARSRLAAFAYIGALLAEPGDRRSCWQLAERAGLATPRRMQALLAEHAWDWAAALAALQRFVLVHLGDAGAIVVLDETAELKKGTRTVGVARQHAGITGQVENCQTVVFAAYVTARAHILFDFRLYLPKQWCGDEQRRQRAHVPDEVEFTTKPALGTAMITAAADAGAPFAWVAAADEVYGRSGKLREACEKAGKGYVVAVPDLALLPPPHRPVDVRPGAAGHRRRPPGPARHAASRRQQHRAARGLARHRQAVRHRRRSATGRRPRPGQGQRPRGPPPPPPGHHADEPRRYHAQLKAARVT